MRSLWLHAYQSRLWCEEKETQNETRKRNAKTENAPKRKTKREIKREKETQKQKTLPTTRAPALFWFWLVSGACFGNTYLVGFVAM